MRVRLPAMPEASTARRDPCQVPSAASRLTSPRSNMPFLGSKAISRSSRAIKRSYRVIRSATHPLRVRSTMRCPRPRGPSPARLTVPTPISLKRTPWSVRLKTPPMPRRTPETVDRLANRQLPRRPSRAASSRAGEAHPSLVCPRLRPLDIDHRSVGSATLLGARDSNSSSEPARRDWI